MTDREICQVLLAQGHRPESWVGEIHLHCVGKTGETLFAHGVIPCLRRVLPQARIVWHTLAKYLRVRERLDPVFHADAYEEIFPPAQSYNAASAAQAALIRDARSGILFEKDRMELDLYRTHRWFPRSIARRRPRRENPYFLQGKSLPFYQLFATAAGLLPEDWSCPRANARCATGDLALLLPTANAHSRESCIQLAPSAWHCLAQHWRARGLRPVANAFIEDPALDPSIRSAGFEIVSPPNTEACLDLVVNAQVLVGLNTGMTFAHLLTGPTTGETYMIDPQRNPIYFWDRMQELALVPARHHQLQFSEWSAVATWLQA